MTEADVSAARRNGTGEEMIEFELIGKCFFVANEECLCRESLGTLASKSQHGISLCAENIMASLCKLSTWNKIIIRLKRIFISFRLPFLRFVLLTIGSSERCASAETAATFNGNVCECT